MPVISFVTQKGGSGKSTLAINCAVVASQSGKRVVLLDMDGQGTAELWWQTRQQNHKLEKPEVIRIKPGQVDKVLTIAKEMGFDWVLMDTPGHDAPWIGEVIGVSDLCLIPCRPTAVDIKALRPTIETVKRLNRPAAFVLTQTPPRSGRVEDAQSALSDVVSVCPVPIVSRTAYYDAIGAGYGVTEYDAEGKAAEEIRDLWQWITKRARKVANG